MAVELDDLVDSLDAAINEPGAAQPLFDTSDHDPWINALAAAFWTAKSRGRAVGLWANYRVTVAGDAIVNIKDASVDIDREDLQIVVLQAAMTAIETKMMSLPTHVKQVAGPVSTEVDRSATTLREILVDRRAELEDALKSMRGGNGTRTYVIDAILQRSNFGTSGFPHFVN